MPYYSESVMSEGHAMQLYDQLVYDRVLPRNSVPVVDNIVSFILDSDGCVVMDNTIVTVLSVREVNHEDKLNKGRKTLCIKDTTHSTARNSSVGNPYLNCWFPY